MNKTAALRIAPGADGVSIWSSELFGDAEPARLRDFLSRAFSVHEVERVELRRAKASGRICFRNVENPANVWRKLSQALRTVVEVESTDTLAKSAGVDTGLLYLDGPEAKHVRVTRIGDALTTWRLRHQGTNTLALYHPLLRSHRDVAFRLEEELAAILGVEDFRANPLTGRVSVRFDRAKLTPGRLARELEKAWPRLLDGLDGPPSNTRFAAAVGVLGLGFTGQYVVPAVRPIAVLGAALYSSPNVVNAAKDLRHGQVGLSALYSTGLAFMLISGMPFTSGVMSTLMQLWPHLTRRKLVRSQRRLFAGPRRRPTWARLAEVDGTGGEVHIDDLDKDDVIVVQSGEIIPVDGVVEDGYAAVLDRAAFGQAASEDRARGDTVTAGGLVHDGSLKIRVQRTGRETSASYLDSLLPHALINGLPSSQEAERVANRNAKPALALAAASLFATRTLQVSQAVIRPDYATGPRLSAQLSALQGVGDGLLRGLVFRNPAALDRLSEVDTYVFDDSAGLDRQSLQVVEVLAVEGVSVELIAQYARAAQWSPRAEQQRALTAYTAAGSVRPNATAVSRRAGVARFRDHLGSQVEVAAPWYLAAAGISIPKRLLAAAQTGAAGATKASRTKSRTRRTDRPVAPVSDEPVVPPLWVLREGAVLGVVKFARSGEAEGSQVVAALRAQNPRAQFVYVSRQPEAAALELGSRLDFQRSFGGLTPAAKLDLLRGLSGKVLWVGDGSRPEARELVAASAVSVSVGSIADVRDDAADILLLQRGLAGLSDVIEVGLRHGRRLADDYRAVYTVNLLGLLGAFLARFTSLQAGLLSHAGAALIYARHARGLDKLAAKAETRRTALLQLTAG